jgi:hypothetical protein
VRTLAHVIATETLEIVCVGMLLIVVVTKIPVFLPSPLTLLSLFRFYHFSFFGFFFLFVKKFVLLNIGGFYCSIIEYIKLLFQKRKYLFCQFGIFYNLKK